ncbi:hypothetical protein UCRNP2_5351 [Neofusicoccum parvum UCRNP2]|uniref:PD-(D/E)XK nuclease-like domain-containing protein n=1 Tax=Botryosphaeria parva (strain UCR-NP2) TaxID=1287680 RepID=R1EK37_BOTPV|nr:hypothetical protein UCRNP2_5351 [Neofusicoccum parvum UCRNP2]
MSAQAPPRKRARKSSDPDSTPRLTRSLQYPAAIQSHSHSQPRSQPRSTSPVKSIPDLKATNLRLAYIPLSDALDDGLLDAGLHRLYTNELLECEMLTGVVPRPTRDCLDTLHRPPRLRDHNFRDDARPALDVQLELRDVREIEQRSLDTEAHIFPKDLVPRDSQGLLTESKLVDYCIFLRCPQLEPALLAALSAEQPLSVPQSANHTALVPLRYQPIAVSIETKTPSGNDDYARAQLAVWGSAHLERLRRLRRGARPPTLPLLLVSGVDWDLYFVRAADDGPAGGVQMLGSHRLGDTKSVVSIYKLLAGLRALARWAETEYREWWRELLAQTTTRNMSLPLAAVGGDGSSGPDSAPPDGADAETTLPDGRDPETTTATSHLSAD